MGLWFLRPTGNWFSSFYGLRLTPLGSFISTTQRVPSITLISFSTFRTLKYSVSLLQAMKLTGHAWSHKAWSSAVINCFSTALIGAFRSLLFTQGSAPSAVRCHTALLLLCFIDRGHPRFWNFYTTIAVDVVRVKLHMNCLFDPARVVIRARSINFTSFQSGLCPVLWACSETAEVSVRASRMSQSCSLILSCIGLPVSPMYTLPHSYGIL